MELLATSSSLIGLQLQNEDLEEQVDTEVAILCEVKTQITLAMANLNNLHDISSCITGSLEKKTHVFEFRELIAMLKKLFRPIVQKGNNNLSFQLHNL